MRRYSTWDRRGSASARVIRTILELVVFAAVVLQLTAHEARLRLAQENAARAHLKLAEAEREITALEDAVSIVYGELEQMHEVVYPRRSTAEQWVKEQSK